MIRQAQAHAPRQGRLVTRPSDGVIEARASNGRLIAHFNPTTNETRNPEGTLIGKGNRLAAILRDHEGPSPQPQVRRG